MYNHLKTLGYKLAYSNGKTIQDYMTSIKDEIPKMAQSGIYQITCPICNDSYIGQTTRKFNTRLKKHQYDCKITMTSAVAEHCNEKNHKFDVLQNAKILEVVRNNRVIDALPLFPNT